MKNILHRYSWGSSVSRINYLTWNWARIPEMNELSDFCSRVTIISFCQLQYKTCIEVSFITQLTTYISYTMIHENVVLVYFSVTISKLEASCKAHIQLSQTICSHLCAHILPPALSLFCPRACISDEQGNRSPSGLQRRQMMTHSPLCSSHFLSSFPTWTSHNFSRCCLVLQHLSPSLSFSQFHNL